MLGRLHCSLLLSSSYSVATQSSQRRHVRVSKVQLKALKMALFHKFFFLHLFLALASAQWWGLQGGFRPRVPSVDISPGRLGAQRGIGVPKQPGGFFRASSSNFFRVSESSKQLSVAMICEAHKKGLLQLRIKQIWTKTCFCLF